MTDGTRNRRIDRTARSAKSEPARLTNVDMTRASALGVGIAAAIYGLAALLPASFGPFHAYLFQRGMIPYVTTFFFGQALAVLVLKGFRIRRQRAAFGLAANRVFGPWDSSHSMAANEGEAILAAVEKLPPQAKELMLIRRVKKAARRMKNAQSSSEVDSMLSSLSEIDANVVDTSFGLLRFFVALIPILGFLGTVFGIGLGIGTFASVLETAEEFETVKPALTEATNGLGIAFDTTLLALLYSGVVLFFMAVIQKREEDLLSEVDDFCLGNLAARSHIPSAGEEQAEFSRKTMDDVTQLLRAVRELAESGKSIDLHVKRAAEGIEQIPGMLEASGVEIVRQIGDQSRKQAEWHVELRDPVEDIARRTSETSRGWVEEAEKMSETLRETARTIRDDLDRTQSKLDELVSALGEPSKNLGELAAELRDVAGKMAPLAGMGDSLRGLEGLERTMDQLRANLATLEPAIKSLSAETARGVRAELRKLLTLQIVSSRLTPSEKEDIRNFPTREMSELFGDGALGDGDRRSEATS